MLPGRNPAVAQLPQIALSTAPNSCSPLIVAGDPIRLQAGRRRRFLVGPDPGSYPRGWIVTSLSRDRRVFVAGLGKARGDVTRINFSLSPPCAGLLTMEFFITPFFANALSFAFEKATMEGKITIGALAICSLISWTVIINKARQLARSGKESKAFFAAFRETRDPMELFRAKRTFEGAPAYEVYLAGAEEVAFQLEHNPVRVKGETKISSASFESVMVTMDRAAGAEALELEKGMIVLSTAVAGGPFIGLLGTVWGVMETFSGIAIAKAASLTAMAPGVAGALIATVIGLFVAIPAMFAYNFMITTIRHTTQEMDNFNAELTNALEHKYVDNRALADEIAEALRGTGRSEAPTGRLESAAVA